MKHIASVVNDGVAHYGLVDEETGELIQFAQILVPEHWDLHSSALLGTNLVDVIGLNGTKRRKPQAPQALSRANVQPELELPPATATKAPRAETPQERQRRYNRESYDRKKARLSQSDSAQPGTRAKAKPENKVKRFISTEEVLAIIDQHPEGITALGVATIIWQTVDGIGLTEQVPPRWLTRSVENRLASCQMRDAVGKAPLPFRLSYREQLRGDGQVSGIAAKYLHPLEGS